MLVVVIIAEHSKVNNNKGLNAARERRQDKRKN